MDIDVPKRPSSPKTGLIDQTQWSCPSQIGPATKRMTNTWTVPGFSFVCSVTYVIWTGLGITAVVGMPQFPTLQLLGGLVNLLLSKKTGECSDCGLDYSMRVHGTLPTYYCVIVKVDNKYMYYSTNFFLQSLYMNKVNQSKLFSAHFCP